LELTKIRLKIWVSTGRTTGKSNFMNDKGIPLTLAASDLMNSVIDLTLTYRGKREFRYISKVSSKNSCSNAQHPSQFGVSQGH
jgi:hypothetical protein